MQDTEFYEALLGLKEPWRVTNVKLDRSASRVDVWVADRSGVKWHCSECGKKASVYDHSEERVWRHLNTCQFGTYIHARLPRVKCPEHGVRQVCAPWAEPDSRFTLLYENWVIDTLKECDVTGSGTADRKQIWSSTFHLDRGPLSGSLGFYASETSS